LKYFCNTKLSSLKNLETLVGKNLSFGGIISNVQYRVGKTGKDWAMFTLEGYEESFDFKIFNEEYLKFKHFLVNNQFVYFKVLIKEGWVNRDTGKKSDPQIVFQDAKLLADVLPTFAKKLIIQLNIKELQENLVHQLNAVFQSNKGDSYVDFEIMEIEKIKRQIEVPIIENIENEENEIDNIVLEDYSENETPITVQITEVEENKIITRLSMPSRKLKIKISNELLQELEKMQVDFKLN
jgi:DNA polymerase-3 subunit alpha